MTRDWQPGDVAMVRNEHGVWNRAILQVHPRRNVWQYGVAWTSDDLGPEARPLAVIDPEDREQVEGLRDLFDAEVIRQGNDPDPRDVSPGARANALQAALREFADPKPPKPDEPMNWLAAVEDSEGDRWVRDGLTASGKPWWNKSASARGEVGSPRANYSSIDVVRVLSEGVTT